jgi:nicotinamide-nucleotide amidase
MHGEIITIGNELTSGRTLDLNGGYAAGRLTAAGLRVSRITSVGDNYEMVSEALARAVETSRFVIVTGGLGSTEDDLTSEFVAEALKRPLCLDGEMFDLIKKYVESRDIEMTPSLEKMAWMPDGSRILNPKGTACGFRLVEKGVRLYFLPGVPDQMRYLMDVFVIPEIVSLYNTLPVMRQRIMRAYGLNEPAVAEVLKILKGKTGQVVLGFYPSYPEVHITISLRGESEAVVTQELDRAQEDILKLVGHHVFAIGNEEMEEVVGQRLLEKGMTISVAESCTGGQIGHRLTNVSGSSEYFQGGVVAYGNRSKVDLLAVSGGTLERYGAVSGPVAQEMAKGVRGRFGTDLGLSVTGVAGPTGGTPQKPVGTVHVGLAHGARVLSGQYRFWGSRIQVKHQSATMALDWVRRYLNGDPFLPGI